MEATAVGYSCNISTPEDVLPAAYKLRDLGEAAGGLRVGACANIASRQPLTDHEGNILAETVFGWTGENERWWENPRLALISPIPRACRYESEPFWCNAQGFHTRQANSFLDEIDLSDFEKRTVVRAAIVVPVHLPFGQVGVCSFSPRDERVDLAAPFEAFADILAVATHRFIAGYVKAHRQRSLVPADCQLTKREVECLRWAAVGKTDREISMILSRSHATIRFHIKNAGEKLNTVNRSQTIFKAAQLGFLGTAA